jgi:hypothetical protein
VDSRLVHQVNYCIAVCLPFVFIVIILFRKYNAVIIKINLR